MTFVFGVPTSYRNKRTSAITCKGRRGVTSFYHRHFSVCQMIDQLIPMFYLSLSICDLCLVSRRCSRVISAIFFIKWPPKTSLNCPMSRSPNASLRWPRESSMQLPDAVSSRDSSTSKEGQSVLISLPDHLTHSLWCCTCQEYRWQYEQHRDLTIPESPPIGVVERHATVLDYGSSIWT